MLALVAMVPVWVNVDAIPVCSFSLLFPPALRHTAFQGTASSASTLEVLMQQRTVPSLETSRTHGTCAQGAHVTPGARVRGLGLLPERHSHLARTVSRAVQTCYHADRV